jgi:sugar/nucleoside kinase (ribokinase family)
MVTHDYQTGMVIALCHPDGERSFFPDARANSALSSEQVPWDDFADVTHLYVSGYTLLNSSTRAWAYDLMLSARSRGVTVVLDPASSGPLAAVAAAELRLWLQATDVLIPNQQEFSLLSALVPDIHSLVGTIAAKQGADGVTLYSAGHETHIPAVPATIIDTVGAGDAFAAGLLCGLAGGRSFEDSAHLAVKVAAQAVSIRGAQPSASSTLAII